VGGLPKQQDDPVSGTLRDFLIASGVDPKDITEAVRESRGFVAGIERWAHLGVKASSHVAAKAKPGSIVQKGALLGVGVSSVVASKASVLLGRGRKAK
jgi:hypothetical protein